MTPVLAIRTDANHEVGAGHLMRCLALAQAWQDANGRCVFLVKSTASHFIDRLTAESIDIVSLADNLPNTVIEQAIVIGAEWLVIDGYGFDRDYQSALAAGPIPLLAFDDNGETGHYTARLVLNQNGHASPEIYADRGKDVELLLGLGYTLIRREFRDIGPRRRAPRPIENVLVTLGGAGYEEVTRAVVDGLLSFPDAWAHCTVVLDSSYSSTSPRVTTFRHVDDIASHMQRGDFAVTAGGSTILEAAAMGLPTLAVILAENQAHLARFLAVAGGCFEPVNDIGRLRDHLADALCDHAARAKMSLRGPRLVDGEGSSRVVSRMGDILRDGKS